MALYKSIIIIIIDGFFSSVFAISLHLLILHYVCSQCKDMVIFIHFVLMLSVVTGSHTSRKNFSFSSCCLHCYCRNGYWNLLLRNVNVHKLQSRNW